ncbi:MAG TPA: hypothetical protein VL463_11250 [Kofleriaceae bacterium]|nr:hypothetical protein [Kofleriaceae bacterium]
MRAWIVIAVVAWAARAHAECDDAKAAIKAGDLTVAARLVGDCDTSDPIHVSLAKTLDAKGYSQVTIVTKPEGIAVTLDARPDLELKGGDEVWLPAGTYTFGANGMGSTVTVKKRAHAVVLLEVPGAAPEPHAGTIDFGDEGGGEVVNGPPPKIVHPSLIKDRYQKGLDANAHVDNAAACDEEIEDCHHATRPLIGFAVGGGVTGGDASYEVAAVTRIATIIQLEAAWLHRGTRYDAIAIPVLVRSPSWHQLAGAIGAQGELRFDNGTQAGVSAIAQLDARWANGFFVDLRAQVAPSWTVGARVGLLF